jgi:hypothetical protein
MPKNQKNQKMKTEIYVCVKPIKYKRIKFIIGEKAIIDTTADNGDNYLVMNQDYTKGLSIKKDELKNYFIKL